MLALIVAFTSALIFLPSGAFAQPYLYEHGRSARYQRPSQKPDMKARLDLGQCHPWCPEDHTPCDPLNFKVADGRCRPAGAMGFSG
jgi:hypothetical protein